MRSNGLLDCSQQLLWALPLRYNTSFQRCLAFWLLGILRHPLISFQIISSRFVASAITSYLRAQGPERTTHCPGGWRHELLQLGLQCRRPAIPGRPVLCLRLGPHLWHGHMHFCCGLPRLPLSGLCWNAGIWPRLPTFHLQCHARQPGRASWRSSPAIREDDGLQSSDAGEIFLRSLLVGELDLGIADLGGGGGGGGWMNVGL